jgi:hypothetical protein
MVTSSNRLPGLRKHLSADVLYEMLRAQCERITDPRGPGATIRLPDSVMAAFAMFVIKDPSLLAFDGRRNDQNMKNLFGIETVPSDTQMREILDPLDPAELRPLFSAVFRELQRGKVLSQYVFHKGCYLLSLDGTGYFSSQKIHCASCLQKSNKKTGEVTYHHQMLGAVLVHPDHREVIPFAPEPIQNSDGNTKNDCERNAGKRLLEQIRKEHPHLKLIVVEDGLASNAPHIRCLQALQMHFILGAKPGDHLSLFQEVTAAYDDGRITTLEWQEKGVPHSIAFVNQIPLNSSNPNLLVNYLFHAIHSPSGEIKTCFTWVTDLDITRGNAQHLARGGRCRWKIENETFNTLKNQGYHYEHNYGHGEKHLSVVFASLMMLAFLTDQVQQLCCPLFGAVLRKVRTKRALWEKIRSHFAHFIFHSMTHLLGVMLNDLAVNLPAPSWDSSS